MRTVTHSGPVVVSGCVLDLQGYRHVFPGGDGFIVTGSQAGVQNGLITGADVAIVARGICSRHRYRYLDVFDCGTAIWGEPNEAGEFVWWDWTIANVTVKKWTGYAIDLQSRQGGASGSVFDQVTINNFDQESGESRECLGGIRLSQGGIQDFRQVKLEWMKPFEHALQVQRIGVNASSLHLEGIQGDSPMIDVSGKGAELYGVINTRSCQPVTFTRGNGLSQIFVRERSDDRQNVLEDSDA